MPPVKQNDYTYPVIVEFEDVDSYEIVHHTKLVAYLERARVHFFLSRGIDLHKNNYCLVLYDLNIRFIKPAKFLDKLKIAVYILSIESYTLTLGYKVYTGKGLIAKAKTALAFTKPDTQEIIPVQEDFIKKLDKGYDE